MKPCLLIKLLFSIFYLLQKIENLISITKFKTTEISFENRDDVVCRNIEQDENDTREEMPKTNAQKEYGFPVANKFTKLKYENERGTDNDVGYLFDYLDIVLKDKVVKLFTEIWSEVSNVNENELTGVQLEDKYELNNMINKINKWNSIQSTSDDIEKYTTSEKIEKMLKICPDFNYDVYQTSIKMTKLSYILKTWHYSEISIQKIMDKFDVDGDGRLNVKEFILFTIIMSKYSEQTNNCKGCYYNIFESIIDPMFEFFDCGNTSYVEPQDLCEGLLFLNRKNPNSFNMFKCKLNGRIIHTASCNSFVLKNNKYVVGKLTKNEFRKGILLGYWNRHVTKNGIFEINNEKISLINNRWDSSGKTDKSC